ncbi:hypothetical protein [Nocardia sp. N2S4-5]|uniref:hypothetical protein n=1 Tax=Nocardia sp. N2S4-5 TaxID=3351565 RepID=UPI0037D67546
MNIDWQIYYEAAKKCHALAADLRRADKPVHDAIKNECGGMAGDAPGCRQWGESYDRTARDTMQACTNLADALTNFGNVLYANGYNYGIANRSKPPPERPNVRDMSVYQVTIPTSVHDNGIGIEHGGGVKELFDMLIAQIIQQFGKLPNGDVKKLEKASSVWRTFADHATVTGAAGRITEIIGLFDRIEDKNTLPLVLDHLNTLHGSATQLVTATTNLAGPVAEYHTSTVNVRHQIESAVTQAEWAIGLTVVAAAAAAWFTFGGSAAAGAGGVSAIVTNTINTIRTVYQSSNLIKAIGLTAATAGAIGTIKAFDAIPTLDSTLKSLESIIIMRVLLDDDDGHDGEQHPGSADDFDGTGYSLDEIAEFARGHAGDDNPAMGRPSLQEIEETLKNGKTSPGEGNSVRYDYKGVRVIVNRDLPWRSTTYYPSR